MTTLLEPLQPALDRVLRRQGHELTDAEFADAASKFGLNIRPGADDDGWETCPTIELCCGTRMHLYKDGEALGRIFEILRRAEKQILIETYIWAGDGTGEAFANLLCEKAEAGVQVFVIYDGFGSMLTPREPLDRMKASGVHVVEFHPPRFWQCRWRWRPFNRDHRKLFVVDNKIACVGGLNIGTRYAGKWVDPDATPNPARMWRDAGVGVSGPAARHFAEAFRRTWDYCLDRGHIDQTLYTRGIDIGRRAKGHRLGKVRESLRRDRRQTPGVYPETVIERGSDVAFLGTSPTFASPLRPVLYRLLRDARRSIDLTTAYFAPDDELIEGLCRAGRRGVRVRLLFAGRTDVPAVKIAGRSFYNRLMDAGAEIWERQGCMLHQKTIVIDGNVSVIGSTNLDYRSIEFNLELSIMIRSPDFAERLSHMFDLDTQYSEKIDPALWRERPTRDRIVQWAISRMRYFL